MKALSKNNENPQGASKPFDKDRDGFILSEGAGMLMLEDYDEAKNACEYHWRNYWLWNHE